MLQIISSTAHTGAKGSWYLLFAANLSCLTKDVCKTPSKEKMAYGYAGLLSRVLPEPEEGRTRWKLLTLNHFCFYPSEIRDDLGISWFLQKKGFPPFLSAKQASEWSKMGEWINLLRLYCDMQCCSIWHLWVTEWERGPRVMQKVRAEGSTQARGSGVAYHPLCGSSCTGAAGNSGIYTLAWASSYVWGL